MLAHQEKKKRFFSSLTFSLAMHKLRSPRKNLRLSCVSFHLGSPHREVKDYKGGHGGYDANGGGDDINRTIIRSQGYDDDANGDCYLRQIF